MSKLEELSTCLSSLEASLFSLLSPSDRLVATFAYQDFQGNYNALFGDRCPFTFPAWQDALGNKVISGIMYKGELLNADSFSRHTWRVRKVAPGGKYHDIDYTLLSALCSVCSLLSSLSQKGLARYDGVPEAVDYGTLAATVRNFIGVVLNSTKDLLAHQDASADSYRQPIAYALDTYAEKPDFQLAQLLMSNMGPHLGCYRPLLETQVTNPDFADLIKVYNKMVPESTPGLRVSCKSPGYAFLMAPSPVGGEHIHSDGYIRIRESGSADSLVDLPRSGTVAAL